MNIFEQILRQENENTRYTTCGHLFARCTCGSINHPSNPDQQAEESLQPQLSHK